MQVNSHRSLRVELAMTLQIASVRCPFLFVSGSSVSAVSPLCVRPNTSVFFSMGSFDNAIRWHIQHSPGFLLILPADTPDQSQCQLVPQPVM